MGYFTIYSVTWKIISVCRKKLDRAFPAGEGDALDMHKFSEIVFLNAVMLVKFEFVSEDMKIDAIYSCWTLGLSSPIMGQTI